MVTEKLKLISKFQDEDFEVGEVVDAITSITSDETNRIMIMAIADKGSLHTKFYNTILDFSEDWGFYEDCEDVIPKEPLIKDEKIKKLLGQIVEMELLINQITREFEEFNKQFTELCREKNNESTR